MSLSNKASSAVNQQGRLNVKLTPDYIVGLADGEGYFSVSARINKSRGWNCHDVRMVFGIDLNVIDGRILYDLRDWFGCGNISLKKEKREKFSDQLRFQVADTESIFKVIIPFFQRYRLKLPKKVKAFEKFVEIAKMKERKEHIGPEGFLKAKQLASQLHI
ncbi:MAG: LAGLIDADG family homing endonuclease [Candidatus Yanofskybacteria bacterium]|nr:LAGLIDADG family homing endonuclease [Candidatus Yanofskybacteria bacterium]